VGRVGGSGDKYRPHAETLGGEGRGNERDCAQIRFLTTLQQATSAPVHDVGDLLELLRIPSGELFVIGAVDDDGVIVGTVIEELADLLRCTASGFVFVAEVESVDHGIHHVRVRPSAIEGALPILLPAA